MRRRQSVIGGVWYMDGKRRRRQRGGMFLIGALAAPILGTLGGVVVKKLFGGKKRQGRVRYVQRQSIVKTKSYTKMDILL